MTWNQFLKECATIKFKLDDNKRIRAINYKTKNDFNHFSGEFACCPIIAVANKKAKKRKYSNWEFKEAAEYINLNLKFDIECVVYASDNTYSYDNTLELRKQLLEAVNLK